MQEAPSCSPETRTYIDQHLRCGLDNFQIESFQSADAQRKFFSQDDFGIGDDSRIEDHSHIFKTLYYRDIFKYIQLLWAHRPFQVHLEFEPVLLADSDGYCTCSEMNTGDQLWDRQDQTPAGAMVVPVICASANTQLTKFVGYQHAWPLYYKIREIQKDIWQTPKKRPWILVGVIPCHPQGAKRINKQWHSAVGTVLSPLWNLNITGPSLKWNCADGFQRHCYHLLVAWVRDYPEQITVAQVTYGSCPICEMPQGPPIWHSIFQRLANSKDQHVYSMILEESNI
jgi:hypothetical protein